MSGKRKRYDNSFKIKTILEVLKEESTIAQIASKYNVTPKMIIEWKKKFLENAEIAMDPAGATKEYKEKINELEKKVDKYAKTVGKLTVERNWAVGKSGLQKEIFMEPAYEFGLIE